MACIKEEMEKKEENEKLVECFGNLRNRLAVCFNRVLFSGCCLIVGRLRNVSVCFYRCVSVACESAIGDLWNVSVCFL